MVEPAPVTLEGHMLPWAVRDLATDRKDGVLRHHLRRRDGSVRDSVMYSVLASEWPAVRRNLEWRLGLEPG